MKLKLPDRAWAPHCDQAVLHFPGACQYCDEYPEWQEARMRWNIAFTGMTPADGELPCPSDVRRPFGMNQVWGGNKPKPLGTAGSA